METTEAIEIMDPLGCSQCGWGHKDYAINVVSLTSDQKKWVASGKGALSKDANCSCAMCGTMFDAVIKTIPIQVDSIACPACGSNHYLKFSVTKLIKDNEAFEFEVIISCAKCKKMNSFKKILSKLLGMIKIEYKTAGISIKDE